MPDKSYKVNNEVFDIPEGKIQGFLIDFPGAIEIETFTVEQDTFDIPTTKVEEFLAEVPNAIPLKKKTFLELLLQPFQKSQDQKPFLLHKRYLIPSLR